MYSEDELLPLSALQHLAFCERQCALIHIERAWQENRLTAEGRIMHERVHEQGHETRKEVRVERGVFLRCLRLGLVGQADVVEFHREGGTWCVFPVEYKRGKPKSNRCDEIQLCAQAFCLEEMLETDITAGALFYGQTRRRVDVMFNTDLRALTEKTAEKLHFLIDRGETPPAVFEKKCKNCSLLDICMPKASGGRSAQAYLEHELKTAMQEEEG